MHFCPRRSLLSIVVVQNAWIALSHLISIFLIGPFELGFVCRGWCKRSTAFTSHMAKWWRMAGDISLFYHRYFSGKFSIATATNVRYVTYGRRGAVEGCRVEKKGPFEFNRTQIRNANHSTAVVSSSSYFIFFWFHTNGLCMTFNLILHAILNAKF